MFKTTINSPLKVSVMNQTTEQTASNWKKNSTVPGMYHLPSFTVLQKMFKALQLLASEVTQGKYLKPALISPLNQGTHSFHMRALESVTSSHQSRDPDPDPALMQPRGGGRRSVSPGVYPGHGRSSWTVARAVLRSVRCSSSDSLS